jgi:hypothetical protein
MTTRTARESYAPPADFAAGAHVKSLDEYRASTTRR